MWIKSSNNIYLIIYISNRISSLNVYFHVVRLGFCVSSAANGCACFSVSLALKQGGGVCELLHNIWKQYCLILGSTCIWLPC